MRALFHKKVPAYVMPLVFAFGCALVYICFKSSLFASGTSHIPVKVNENVAHAVCTYDIHRMDGYEYIRPLMYIDAVCESEKYAPMKADIARVVNDFKEQDQITSASVYFRDLNSSAWISYNDSEKYAPGSLLKVSLLIEFLHLEELHPGTLDKQLMLTQPVPAEKNPLFLSKSIIMHKNYSVRELLRYMICYSDNAAAYVLSENSDEAAFERTFTDIGLPTPDFSTGNYPITAREYSYFMRALYNSSYLSISHSEYAAQLLSTTDFTKGFTESVPADVKMIHKFGESGDNSIHQLHESGIIYLDKKPYILTVMTKGKELEKLPEVIKSISSLVYQDASSTN